MPPRNPFRIISIISILFAATALAADAPPDASTRQSADSLYQDSLMKLINKYETDAEALANANQQFPNNPTLKKKAQSLHDRAHRLAIEAADRATMKFRAAVSTLAQLRERLRGLTNRTDVSPEGLQATVRSLEDQRESLLLNSAATKAREEAISEAINNLSTNARDHVIGDEIISELKKAVDIRAASVKHAQDMYKTGVGSQSDLNSAEADLVAAKVQLAQREEHTANEAAGNAVSSLNEQLVNLMVSEKEQKAKLDFISKRLEPLSKALDSVDDLQRLQDEVIAAHQRLINAEQGKNWVLDMQKIDQESPPPTTAP